LAKFNSEKKFTDLSVQEVVSKYQGFEGELVCFFEVKGNTHEFRKNLLDGYLEMKKLGNCFFLHLLSSPSEMPSFLKDQVIKLGYDVGACDEEVTLYSSIFHEVIFGYFDELISYKDLLNENLLFPNRAIAEKYVDLHNQMSAEGKNVEDYMEMIIYEVWRHKEQGNRMKILLDSV